MDINYSYFNTAKGYKVVGGTAAQFLKADGSVDSNNYLSQTVANSNFATIQNTGGAAKRTVCINTPQYSTTGIHRIYLGVAGLTGYLKVKITSIYAGSNLAGFIELAGGVGVNSGSFHFNTLRCTVSNGNVRSGYYIDPVLKYDSVTGFIYIEIHKKTAPSNSVYVEVESNSAYILTNPIVLSQTFDTAAVPSNLTNEVDVQGSITAQSFIKTGGTAAQFLKADGSVDTNSYVTNNFVSNGYGGINTRIHPTDYTYWGNPTGAIVIILPAECTYQDNFDIDIVDTQWANLHQKLQINTYGSLAYSKAVLVNDTGAPDVVTRLRVGKLADNRSCLIINDVNTAWSYPQMVVNKYVGGSLTIAKGAWATQLLTDISSITIQQEISIIKAVNSAITSNTTQTGLTGDKTTAGSWIFNGAAANSLTILRPGNTINNSIAMGFNAASLYFGLADSNVFAIGSSPNLALPNRFFWLDQTLFSANLQGQVGGSTLTARDRGGFSIVTTTNTSRAEMIVRHNWSANNVTFGIGGTSSGTAGSMTEWGLSRYLNNRTVNGKDGFFGWEGDTDVLKATALGGIGTRMVTATSTGVLQTQTIPTTDLSSYYTKNEALNQFVGLNGVQTINDTKTFNASPVVPNATLNSHAINYGQFNATLAGFVPLGLLGVNNGVATLGANGIVPANQLPSSFERTLLEFSGNFGEKLVQAINAANNGDTINALNTPFDTADSYTITSSININKPINIKFPAGTINFLGSGNIFNINASNVRFYGTGRSSREDLRIITTNITYANGNGGYHFYARGQNVITVSNMDITGVRTTNYDAQQGSTTKPIDGSGGIYIEKPNPGTTGGGNTISNIILENLLIHGTRAHGIYLDTPILGSIKDVRISQGGGHGIFINGGTSMRIENCYVSSTHKTAYALYAHSYSVMNACAAEFSGNGYWLRGCFNVTLLSCGAESNGNRGATVPNTNITTLAGDGTTVVTISDVGSDNVGLFRGTSYVITGGQGINLINCASTNAGRPSASNGTTVSSRDILVRGNTRNVFIGSPRTSVTSGNIFPGRFNISFEGFNGEFPKGQVMYNPATDGSVAPAVANQYISSINNDANAAPVLIQPGSDVLVMSDTKIHTPITTNQITSAEGLVGNASTASKLQTARVISLTGDATGTINFDGSENISINTALSATGISSGTYKSITVDNKGRVTAGANPTTLAAYGITDAMSTIHIANSITSTLIGNWNTAYGWGDYRKYGFGRAVEALTNYDINTIADTSILGINDNTTNRPFDYGSVWTHRKDANNFTQIAVNSDNGNFHVRGWNANFGNTGWKRGWTENDFSYADINNWGNIAVYGVKKNAEFSSYTGAGLMLADDYTGGEAGLFDAVLERMVAGKEDGFYKYGSQYNYSGGLVIEIATGRMGYGGVMPSPSHNHYFNGTIRITQGIYSESSNGDNVYAGNGGFYHLDQEISVEDKVIRLAPFDKVFSGTNNTFATKNRVVKITLNDGGAIMMDEFFINQEITIMNISGDYATFIVNNTSIKVKIDPRSSATFYVNSENKMVMVRMDNDYCRILG